MKHQMVIDRNEYDREIAKVKKEAKRIAYREASSDLLGVLYKVLECKDVHINYGNFIEDSRFDKIIKKLRTYDHIKFDSK